MNKYTLKKKISQDNISKKNSNKNEIITRLNSKESGTKVNNNIINKKKSNEISQYNNQNKNDTFNKYKNPTNNKTEIKILIVDNQKLCDEKQIKKTLKKICKNKNDKDFEIIKYEKYKTQKNTKDFFQLYYIFFLIPENEIIKNIEKIEEIENDIEKFNPYLDSRIILVDKNSEIDYYNLPIYPFNDYEIKNNNYLNFKNKKNEHKDEIVTFFPKFLVSTKENKIIVKIYFPYINDFSNDQNIEEILNKQLYLENIYIKYQYFNYLINIEGFKDNYLEGMVKKIVISSSNFGYFKIKFTLPHNALKNEYINFIKNIDYENYKKNGIIQIIFEGDELREK